MSLAEMSVRFRYGIAAAFALSAPVAASAAIVVAASGPSAGAYPVGRKLDDAGSVTLRAGDTLTVLDKRGTRVLKGAGTFPVAARAGTPARSSTFAVLTMQRSAQRVRTGAVRAGTDGTPPASPNLWYVDVSRGGRHCLVSGQPVRFWRLDATKAATYSATFALTGGRVALSFAAGATLAPWDATRYPLADGTRLGLSADGRSPVSIDVAMLPRQPADAEAMAAALIEKGCTGQLELLASTLAKT